MRFTLFGRPATIIESSKCRAGIACFVRLMGVRLYDPQLGRFLQVDSVEGGGANDYDYAYQDPINNLDLDGKFCVTGRNKRGGCRGAGFLRKHGTYISAGLAIAALFTPAGWITGAFVVGAWAVGQATIGAADEGRPPLPR